MPGTPSEPDLEIIRRTVIFGGLSDEALAELLGEAAVHSLARGEILFFQSDPANAFFVMLEGWMKIYRLTPSGDEAVVGVFTAGQNFAEAAALSGGLYPASAEAVTDCRVVQIPSENLTEKIRKSPEIALSILASTSRQMHRLVQEIEQLKAHTGAQRVAEFLTSLCPVEEGACTIGLPYDKALIAGRLGMKPESLSRAFARLRAVGVRIDHNTAAISDVARLRNYADDDKKPGQTAGRQ
jgi:CRP-like cAMP-binding protein